MLSIFARILLTITALAPVGLTYAWVAYMQSTHRTAIYILAVTALAVLICILMIGQARKNLAASVFKAKSVEAADHENTAFLLLYVMPLFGSQFNTLNWQFWIPTIFIYGIITATGYSYHFNPLLSLMGWHFYKVDSVENVKFVLITKKHLRSASTEIRVGQLTEYILLDLGDQ